MNKYGGPCTTMAKKSIQFVVGGHLLSVDNYAADKFSRKTQYRWAAQQRISQPTSHQFVGKGIETLSLSGVAYHQFRGTMYNMDGLRAIADNGKPISVVTGTGKTLGKYIVTSINDDYSDLMDDHKAQKNSFSIELKKYYP